MSERVFPDRYGYWIAKTVLGNQVVFRVLGGNGIFAEYTDLRGGIHQVEKFSGEWIASVADIQDRLAAAEAEIAALKQRIAASPVAWVQFGNHNNPCEISEDRETFWAGEHPPGTLRKVRLLEVRDGE